MKNYLITFRSITYAQKGERIVKRGGIDCFLRRTPKALTNKTCGYCLQIRPEDLTRVLEQLKNAQVQFGKVYGLDYEGKFEELAV
ncbi:MAG: DUF3343 domain-containing protein [Oscillospiraceae bacterium]|nr:DUF3343 domain-containing protein [Oscillospiraceae bacterium]